jgi:hypothetical protein
MPMKTNKFCIFFSFLFSIVITFSQEAINPMNLLFIGNSYTHYNSMPMIFEKIAVSKKLKVAVEMNARSNHTLKMHSKRTEMYENIRKKKWDYVVLQGFSREFMYPTSHIDTATVPYLKQILDSIYSNNPCTNVLFYMTWGYKDGFQYNDSLYSYQLMSEKIKSGYKYVADMFKIPIVPAGDVWRLCRESYSNINLYQEDGQHPTLNGSYLVACSFYASIFKATPEGGYIPKIDTTDAQKIQKLAYNYVSNNLDTFKLNQNTIRFNFERTKKGEYFAYGNANYPFADSLIWDLGNGVKTKESNFRWQYKEPGSYTVKLRVYEKCGVREIIRKATFQAPPAPKKRHKSKPTKSKPIRKD